jgi:hypothetical protein
MKVGDLVRTKVSIMNNRIGERRLGLVVSKNEIKFSKYSYNIMKVKFSGEAELFAYREKHLEVINDR